MSKVFGQNLEISQIDQNYIPRLTQIFGDKNSTYAFENFGCGFRLLRFNKTHRSHDLIIVEENLVIFKGDLSKSCHIKFEDLLKFIQELPAVYKDYKRPQMAGKYYPIGDKMTKEEIEKFFKYNLKDSPSEGLLKILCKL